MAPRTLNPMIFFIREYSSGSRGSAVDEKSPFHSLAGGPPFVVLEECKQMAQKKQTCLDFRTSCEPPPINMAIWAGEDDPRNPGFSLPSGEVGGCRARHSSTPVRDRGCPGEAENYASGKTLDETSGQTQAPPQRTHADRGAGGRGLRAGRWRTLALILCWRKPLIQSWSGKDWQR
jgi:hypothetical protein